MSDRRPLMPKATAVWLVENTSLTFDQIAAFCGLHPLEVKGIADGDVAQGIKGLDPVTSGQLTREEIEIAERDPTHELHLAEPKVAIPETPTKKGPRYTPVSRRHDRPNAVLWLLRNHAELKDSQIMRLVGTTKPTIAQIRDRTHWNTPNLTPQDPVTLGLCSQIDLDNEVKKAARRLERERKEASRGMEKAGTLLPTEATTAPEPRKVEIMQPREQAPREETPEEEQARVFAKLKEMKVAEEPAEEDPDAQPAVDETDAGPDAADEEPREE
ncbi:MAG TPA: cell cycle transcriptional regulator TrcR [Hyphomicrobium sp.]